MPTLVGDLPELQQRLDALAVRHRVAGASLAIQRGAETVALATGVVNRGTGVEATIDALFQIGSITKVYTATLVLQLVDAGLVDLDELVRAYVPELELAQPDALDVITVRHLLTHTSGIQGDHFEDFGWGDDSLERYVASLAKLDLVHPPGRFFSYCNSGFNLAGRLVERVTGEPFHRVLRERLLEPLGLRATTVLPEEMLAHRYAIGHVAMEEGAEPRPASSVLLGRSGTPAGTLTSATALDVLGFLRCHLDGGRSPGGDVVLSPASTAAMQAPQHARPGLFVEHVGLGWMLSEWDAHRVIWHTGGTIGQLAFAYALPDDDVAVCLLTNASTGLDLWRDLGRFLFDALAGVRMVDVPPAPADAPADLDLARYAGTYERLSQRYDVTVEDGCLAAVGTVTGPLASLELGPEPTIRLQPYDREHFHARLPVGETVATFLDFDDRGRPQYLYLGRLARRVP